MANYVVRVGGVYYDLSRPVVRKGLIEKVEKDFDCTAFRLLYMLYFGRYACEFHERECSAMRSVLLDLFVRALRQLKTDHKAAAFLADVKPIVLKLAEAQAQSEPE